MQLKFFHQKSLILFLGFGLSWASGCLCSPPNPDLRAKIDRFTPVEISANVAGLPEREKRALSKIIEAAKLMDPLYLRQVWSGNEALLKTLQDEAQKNAPGAEDRLHYFNLNRGPWSRLDRDERFIESAPSEKPLGANYYPEDMTKKEFEDWVASLPASSQTEAKGFFTAVRRDKTGKLQLVPYSKEYAEFLVPAAKLLREAATLTGDLSLRKYLNLRAAAFTSDDYYPSDLAWMSLSSKIDLTMGPYETYEDQLYGYKAAFEAYVAINDDVESKKLAEFGSYLQEVENNLPIDPKYRNPSLGKDAPIRVVNVVFSSGEGNRGVQTAAFNLPNDEKVIKEVGAKRVMLKNIQEAKFKKVLIPISKINLSSQSQADISFEAFFTHILAHELSHGLGPHNIEVAGRQTTARHELKELYSTIEEAKADITGLFLLQYLINKGTLSKKLESQMYTTFLASIFRSIRFGLTEAHAKGTALQFNYLYEKGGISWDSKTEKFSVDLEKVKTVAQDLTGLLLTVQAEGSYDRAKEMMSKYAVLTPVLEKALGRLDTVPVDIEPQFKLPQ